MNDTLMRELLTSSRVIAVVGHTDDPSRPSYQIPAFLRRVGYKVYAVNPMLATVDGEPVYPTLDAVPEPIDMANIFRRSEYLPEVTTDAVRVGAKSVWAQLGLSNAEAAAIAADAGLPMVMNACIKVEYLRLGIRATN